MRRTLTLAILVVWSVVGTAMAQPKTYPVPPAPPRQPAPAPAWDSRGWTMLGEQQVSGRVDRDRIKVGAYQGSFTKLNVVVLDSDLELIDFVIHFTDGTRYEPKLAHYFKEGQRTRGFDMPPRSQVIDHIALRYRNLPGGGRARVQVWGKPGDAQPPAAFDPRGWTLLGERTIDGRVDRDRIDVGRHDGKFTKLMIVAQDSDFELFDFTVRFGRGEPWRPNVRHVFREGQRSRAIDLPGDERTIRSIEFKYANLRGGGRARIQVYAKPDEPGSWDSRGWTLLGERTVQRRQSRDRLVVPRNEGKFRKLTLVVLDSDIELVHFEVKMARGPAFRPEVRHTFREGQRTRVIDLPGDDRVIKWIDLRYRNLAGGGRARVQVWAK